MGLARTWNQFLRGGLLVLLAMVAIPRGAHAQSFSNGTIESVTPLDYPTKVWTDATIRVRNHGVASYFEIVVAGKPFAWSVSPTTTEKQMINRDKTADFTLSIYPPYTMGAAETLILELWAYDYDHDFYRKKVGTFEFQVRAYDKPGPFTLQVPDNGSEGLTQPIPFQWSAIAPPGTTYTFRLHAHENGMPSAQPIYTQSVVDLGNLWLYETDFRLARGEVYFWGVTATNPAGSTENNGGPWFFTMAEAPPLGAFAFTNPSEDDLTLSQTPTFSWTPSANAIDYRFEILPDVQGAPQEPGILDVVTEQTSLALGAPLELGRYWVLVTARNETRQLQVTGGTRPFHVSNLGDFALLEPVADAVGVHQQPVFSWTAAQNTTGYSVELYRDVEGAPHFHQSEDVPAGTLSLTWPDELELAATYWWQVRAFGEQGFERINDGGMRRFTVQPLGEFQLVYPAAGQHGVHTIPTFEWTSSENATAYRVQLTPSLDGQPDLNTLYYSEPLPPQPTKWYSAFEPFAMDSQYFWRVVAIDGTGTMIRISDGDWAPFQTTSVSDFTLLSPVSGATGVSWSPSLSWQSVADATHYKISIEAVGFAMLPVIQTPNQATTFRLVDEFHLNGEREYVWDVEAFTPEGSRFSRRAYRFTTRQRDEMAAMDVVAALLGRQVLSDHERDLVDTAPGVDVATYTRMVQDGQK